MAMRTPCSLVACTLDLSFILHYLVFNFFCTHSRQNESKKKNCKIFTQTIYASGKW